MSTYDDPQRAIDAGGQALRSSNRFPWYDPAKDGLQRVEVRAQEKPNFLHVSPAKFPIYFAALTMLAVVLAALVLMILRAARCASR